MKIAIIDYGMGNLHSVLKSVLFVVQHTKSPATAFLTHNPEEVLSADKVIFPGQGAMPDCMKSLQQSDLGEAVAISLKNKPFFGICVGAQLLFDISEEGNTRGLGHFSGSVKRFNQPLQDKNGNRLKVPHMGWNTVRQCQKHPLFKDLKDNAHFYFVHSYYFAPDHQNIILGESDYPTPFACIVGKDNVFATQFHTEKSGDNGLLLLKNFIEWNGE
ncbi:MAG: imidazole glycerol phosphate synthase subunit HisH [Neisseriaceae bacterium]|nr:imidazole glycerol phosphate synthase subunit HisH [Neisseriaceae bacterium]